MSGSFKSYRDLQVWQKAMPLVTGIYRATAKFPSEEKFGIVSQIRRSAVAIPSNIAEGHARQGPAEFRHHVSIAMGSVAELETQLIISRNLSFLADATVEDFLGKLDIIGKMLRGLQKSLERRKAKGVKPQHSTLKPLASSPQSQASSENGLEEV